MCAGFALSFAGQTSTQMRQPVQSSGETWIVMRIPGRSFARQSFERNPSGAPSSAAGSKTFMRIAACGQTSAHFAQSMQIDSSQIGSSSARFRFSKCAVPTANVPSTGSALTGSRSPLAGDQRAQQVRRRGGDACRSRDGVVASGHIDLAEGVEGKVDGPEVALDDLLAALRVRPRDRLLDRADRAPRGSTSASAKKHVWSTVFVRPGSPASRATRFASTT